MEPETDDDTANVDAEVLEDEDLRFFAFVPDFDRFFGRTVSCFVRLSTNEPSSSSLPSPSRGFSSDSSSSSDQSPYPYLRAM
jgi:hypothetical protein